MKILFTGGGTGGHIYPALAVLDPVRRRGHQVGFVGRRRGREAEIIRRYNEDHSAAVPFYQVVAVPFPRGRSIMAMLRFLLVMLWGIPQGALILLRFRPRVVFGTGGYAAAPLMLAAILLRRMLLYHGRIIVHEQNVQPGLLNRLIARHSTVTAITYPETSTALPGADCTVAGYPVRDEFFKERSRKELRQKLKLDQQRFTLLVFGGSQGARNINQALYQILPELLQADIAVIHVTGTHNSAEYHAVAEGHQYLEKLRSRYPQLDWEKLYRQHDYLFGIADYFSAVDLLTCRAGAGALFEIAATRSPAILLPKAGLPGDHQTLNALSLRERRACEVILEEPQSVESGIECLLNGKRLLEKILELSQNEKKRETIKEQLAAMVPESPVETIVELVINDKRPEPQQDTPDSDLLQLAAMSPARLYYDLENRMNDLTYAPSPEEQEYLRYHAGVLLASSNWWSRNFAVKLIGLLSLNEYLPLLSKLFNDRRPVSHLQQLLGGDYEQRGFVRRNLIEALVQLNSFEKPMGEMIFDGLFDPYWEVVSQSLRATAMYAEHLPQARFLPRIVELMEHRNFEIVAHALQAFGEWARSDEDIWLTEKLFTHHNPRVREGLVRALIRMTRRGVIHHPDRLLMQLQQLLSTSTHFYPLFPLKREIRELTQALSNRTGLDNDSNKLEQS